jgi:hypothetical protein
MRLAVFAIGFLALDTEEAIDITLPERGAYA